MTPKPTSLARDWPISMSDRDDKIDNDNKPRLVSTKTAWCTTRDGLRLDVWRARWIKGDRSAGEHFDNREILFRVVVADDADVLAAGAFHEWGWTALDDPDESWLPTLDEFFINGTDLWSQTAAQMGEAVRHGWRAAERRTYTSPLDYGHVVSFDRLRVEHATAAQSATIWRLIDDLIRREFRGQNRRRGRASIIVMKAFPLKYEGKVTKDNETTFDRRQAAMIRHYRHRMGAVPFDGGEPGWLWIEINCPLQPKPLPGHHPPRRPGALRSRTHRTRTRPTKSTVLRRT